MKNLYIYIEFSLILLMFFRVFWEVNRNDKQFDFRFLEVFLFYMIIFLNEIFIWLKLDNRFAFYFIHCSFPMVLSAVVVKKHFNVSFFLFLGVLIILNNLLLNYGFIILSYLILFFIISNRIYKFSMIVSSPKIRMEHNSLPTNHHPCSLKFTAITPPTT